MKARPAPAKQKATCHVLEHVASWVARQQQVLISQAVHCGKHLSNAVPKNAHLCSGSSLDMSQVTYVCPNVGSSLQSNQTTALQVAVQLSLAHMQANAVTSQHASAVDLKTGISISSVTDLHSHDHVA